MRFIVWSIFLLLSACGTRLDVANSNAESVAVTFNGSDAELKRASALAGSECGQYGKIAILKNVSMMSEGNVASYACVRSGDKAPASSPALP